MFYIFFKNYCGPCNDSNIVYGSKNPPRLADIICIMELNNVKGHWCWCVCVWMCWTLTQWRYDPLRTYPRIMMEDSTRCGVHAWACWCVRGNGLTVRMRVCRGLLSDTKVSDSRRRRVHVLRSTWMDIWNQLECANCITLMPLVRYIRTCVWTIIMWEP